MERRIHTNSLTVLAVASGERWRKIELGPFSFGTPATSALFYLFILKSEAKITVYMPRREVHFYDTFCTF